MNRENFLGLECWWERLRFRWYNFWWCFNYKHFRKYKEMWNSVHSFPPDKDGYK